MLVAGLFLMGFAALLAIGISSPSWAATFDAKVGMMLAPYQITTRWNCLYFTLQGVAQSSALNNGPWFTINKTTFDGGYQESLALLITAQTTGKTVEIITTGQTACGWAEVNSVQLLN
jgi:hypothetical protein